MPPFPRPLLLALSLLLTLPLTRAGEEGPTPQSPWFDGLGRHARPVGTSNDGAQGYFNQGLVFLMAGYPQEAARSFADAVRFDPTCVMAHAGEAMALGPTLERPVPAAHDLAAARQAAARAIELQPVATPLESALAEALRARLAPEPASASEREQAFAAALRQLARSYPEDDDVLAWSVEAEWLAALLTAEEQPDHSLPTNLLQRLEPVLERSPEHPLANRLWVLICLERDEPQRAVAAAERLRTLAPGLGRLRFLAARVDAELGRWPEALAEAEKAVAADARYLELCDRPAEEYRAIQVEHLRLAAQAAVMTSQPELAQSYAKRLDAVVAAASAAPEAELRKAMDDEVVAAE